MSMKIKSNASATRSVNTLNKNENRRINAIKKVATGMRINGASDAASDYAISEKMRILMRGLTQDIQNVQNGHSLLSVAAGGVDNIVDELRNLKELALDAANDTNTDSDRATLQKAFRQKMANIDEIATETDYNGKKLLDGSFYAPNASERTVFSVKDILIPKTSTYYEPPIVLETGSQTISESGVYQLGTGFTGTLTITAENVQFVGDGSTLNNVSFIGDGVKNLYLKDMVIENDGSTDESVIKLSGNDNVLHLLGANKITPLYNFF